MLVFLWDANKGFLGTRESPPLSAGAGAAAARHRGASFLAAEELSARFQTSLILSNLWVSIKSFRLDTRVCRVVLSLVQFPPLCFGNWFVFFFDTSVSQMCPFHKGNSGLRTDDTLLCLPVFPLPCQRS